MKTTRTLLAAIAALTVLLAPAAGAQAATSISSYPADVYSNGRGQIQATVYGETSGYTSKFYDPFSSDSQANTDAGLNLAVFTTSGADATGSIVGATVYGFSGSPFIPLSAPNAIYSGGSWTMTTRYGAGNWTGSNTCVGNPCLEVTELETYTPGAHSVGVEYKVRNVGSEHVRFRLTAGGDTKPGGDEGGFGTVTGAAGSRFVTTTSWNTGTGMSLQEAATSQWSHFQEDTPYEIWRRIEDPLGAGLTDSVVAGYRDKAAAVQYDNWQAAPGLDPVSATPGAVADVTFNLTIADFDPIAFSGGSTNKATYTSDTFLVTITKPDGTPADIDPADSGSTPVYWKVTGVNPQSGGEADGYTQATPDSAGGSTAHISWTGDNPGTDTLSVFADLNGNGKLDSGEALRTQYVYWFDQLSLYAWDTSPYQGGQTTIDVDILDGTGSTWFGKAWQYRVTGGNDSGGWVDGDPANPQITLTGTNAGTDTVEVRTDLDSSLTYDVPREDRTVTLNWQPRLSVTLSDHFPAVGSNLDVDVYAVDTNGGGVDGANVYWSVTGANTVPQTLADPTTYGDTSFNHSAANPGIDTIHVWWDENDNQAYDPGEQSATTTVDWQSTYTQRLTLTGDAENTVGGQASVAVHLTDDQGTPMAAAIRYSRTWGPNQVGDSPAGSTSGVTGDLAAPITWGAGSAQDGDYDRLLVYADLNSNQKQDGNEPSATFYGWWYDNITISATATRYATASYYYASATARDDQGNELPGLQLHYAVTGANPSSGDLTTNSSGNISLAQTGTNDGIDHIVVTGTIDGVPHTASFDQTVQTDLALSAYDQTLDAGGVASVRPALNADYAHDAFRVYHWSVSGANTRSGTVTADQYGTAPYIRWIGANAGVDTLTVWADAPSGGTAGVYDPGIDYAGHAKVTWAPAHFKLQVDATDVSTGTTHHAIATVTDVNGDPLAGQVVRYWIDNANATPGTDGKLAKVTDANGQIDIAYTGSAIGESNVYAYVDTDDDGTRDPASEPQRTAAVRWHPQVETDVNTSLYKVQGNSVTVHATFHGTDYDQLLANTQLKYVITGANAIAAPAVTTDANGVATITWTGTEAGSDTLVVFQDSNDNDQIDSGELQSPPVYVSWQNRLDAYAYSSTTLTTGTDTAELRAELTDQSGNNIQNATLRYKITGANPAQGTITTNLGTSIYNYYGKLTYQGKSGGTDSVLVWLDSNNNGTRDAGEPQDTVTFYWSSTISLSPSSPAAKYVGNSQTINVSENPSVGNIRWSISGPNTQSGTGTTITWAGNKPGYDYVFVYDDKNNNSTWDAGEPSAGTTMTWNSLVTVTPPAGTRVAGGQITVPFVLHDSTGATISGHTLQFKVTGANPKAAASAGGATDGSGAASVTWTSANAGWDTVTVWDDTTANGVVDPNEAQGTADVYWAAPPVTLQLAVATPTKYQGAQQSFTATVAGLTIPPGGFTVHWATSGANAQSGSASTDNAGVATFTNAITGTNNGTDTLRIWADVSGAAGSEDSYDPSAATTLTWLPLVSLSSATTDQVIGDVHTETVHFVDSSGNPLANTQVIYQISGANPTNGQIVARPVGSSTGSRVFERTDGSGNATIAWTGSNPAGGSDTLDVWADSNGNGIVDGAEPHAQKTVTWRTATASGSPGGAGGPTTTPIGSGSAVTPGSANDFDGVPAPPPPVVAKAVNVAPVSGKVFVKLPGKKKFIELLDAEQIPVGSIVDVRKGRVALTSAQNLKGGTATAEFYLGQFQIGQKKASKPITDLTLVGGSFKACGRVARTSALGLAAQKKKIRQLWGSGKGLFRTKGKYASAAIRGTTWDVVDYCDGTLVKVTQGIVTVTDNVKRKNVTVKAPKSYFAALKANAGRKKG